MLHGATMARASVAIEWWHLTTSRIRVQSITWSELPSGNTATETFLALLEHELVGLRTSPPLPPRDARCSSLSNRGTIDSDGT